MEQDKLNSIIDQLGTNRSDEDAWEALYRTCYPYLISIMYRSLGGNKFLAEEAVQEVMLRLFRQLDFRMNQLTPVSLMSYLKQTAQSALVDLIRKESRTPKSQDKSSFDVRLEAELADFRIDPERRSELNHKLARALAEFCGRDRLIAESLLEGRTIGEMAHSLSVSDKTAYALIASVRRQMRYFLFENRISPPRNPATPDVYTHKGR